jgi:hypothetical protein
MSERRFAVSSMAAFLLIVFGAAVMAQAQGREQYVISAKVGGINLIAGDARVKRRGAAGWRSLTSQDNLDDGDLVQTGADGRVEVLLNPGSYLRLAESTELELTDASLDSLRLRLLSGSAVLEITGTGDRTSPVEITTPQTKVSADRKGVYRVNVSSADLTLVRVRKGRALVGGTEVKDGKQITVDRGGAANAAKFDKDAQDSFDLWSEQRAEALVAANRKLSRSAVASAYSGYRNNPFGGRRGFSSRGGFWVYAPFFDGHTFLPYSSGWSSPYGHGYGIGIGFPRYGAGFGSFGGHGHGGTRVVIHGGHHGGGHHGGRH